MQEGIIENEEDIIDDSYIKTDESSTDEIDDE